MKDQGLLSLVHNLGFETEGYEIICEEWCLLGIRSFDLLLGGGCTALMRFAVILSFLHSIPQID